MHTVGLHVKAQSKGTCFSHGGLLVCRKHGDFLKQLLFLLGVKLELQHWWRCLSVLPFIHVLRVKHLFSYCGYTLSTRICCWCCCAIEPVLSPPAEASHSPYLCPQTEARRADHI